MTRGCTPFLVGLFVALAGCTLAPGGWDEAVPTVDPAEREEWSSHMEAAEVAAGLRRYGQAEREILAAIGSLRCPSGHEGLVLGSLRRLTRLYEEGGQPDAATRTHEKALAFALEKLGPDHSETALVRDERTPGGAAVSFTGDESPGLQDQDPEKGRKSEFRNDVNLWPVLESTRLSTGDDRTALWPLFHVTTRPNGDVLSWHVLNFLYGPRYDMLLPLYYSYEGDFALLPLLLFAGADYWTALPLMSARWGNPDGGHSTWITPLFHSTTDAQGDLRSFHAGPYFEWQEGWAVPPLLSGGWTSGEGDRTTWVTPLFHVTEDPAGRVRNFHAGFYFEGEQGWWIPPLMTWHREFETGEASSWVTPLLHWTQDREGELVSFHAGPYLAGRDYWMLLPMAGGGTYGDGSSTLWVTPLFHRTQDKKGDVQSFHVGPYFEGSGWWAVPPLLTYGWREGEESRMTTAMILWMRSDPLGLASATLCPVLFWERDDHWFVPPIVSGHWRFADGSETTWITPLFHRSLDREGNVTSVHVGAYFEGEDYWAVPPLLSWHVRYPDRSETTWLTPCFHMTLDPEGALESAHLLPAFFWKRDAWWAVPPLLCAGWKTGDGSRTTWITPLAHLALAPDGDARSFHLAPLCFWKRNDYWIVPPLLSGGGAHADGSQTTWVTPLFHDRVAADGSLLELDVLPLWDWARDRYWVIPPLLSGGATLADGSQTTWITPFYSQTLDKEGALESLRTLPFFLWKNDAYWFVPLALSGAWTGADRSRVLWVTPLYHDTLAADGHRLTSHILNYIEGEEYHHLIPLLWDWKTPSGVRRTIVPPVFLRTEEANGDTMTSIPWLIAAYRKAQALDRSVGMELRPFLYQDAGDQYEINFLWRLFSVLSEEKTTRLMVGPFWRTESPKQGGGLSEFQVLGGLFGRDCNYETGQYRYRIFWKIQVGSPQSMKMDTLGLLDLRPVWGDSVLARVE